MICYKRSDEKWTDDIAYPFVEWKLFSCIQVSSIISSYDLCAKLSIWEIYAKYKRGVFQISCESFFCLFVCLFFSLFFFLTPILFQSGDLRNIQINDKSIWSQCLETLYPFIFMCFYHRGNIFRCIFYSFYNYGLCLSIKIESIWSEIMIYKSQASEISRPAHIPR